MKKAARPQSAGSGYNPGPGRKRYFVNIVTQDQILEFQNEVSSKNVVPLLAPGKRENRLLILAPNTETIDTFQKRVLTQYQYNANVSADAVKLLESHFCEVPRSYSVVDALDARSEAYLVVQNIRALGPGSGSGSKRKISEPSSFSPTPEASPREDSSTKRVRRREKVARLVSSESEDTTLQSPLPQKSTHEQLVPGQKDVPSSTHKPLFGRTRAVSERRLSSTLTGKPDTTVAKQVDHAETPAPETPSKKQTPSQPSRAAVAEAPKAEDKSTSVPASQEIPKPKRGRPAKATQVPTLAAKPAAEQEGPVKSLETPKRSGKAKSNSEMQEETPADSGAVSVQVQESSKAKPSAATENIEKATASGRPNVKLVGEPTDKRAKGASEPPQSNSEQNSVVPKNAEDVVAESEMSTDSSGAEDNESSGSESESDSGERLRRLSRRRVVAVPNGASSSEPGQVNKAESDTKSARKPENPRVKAASAPSSLDAEPKPEPRSQSKQETQRGSTQPASTNESPVNGNNKTEKSPAGNASSRVPGLGNLADLANMRLPTVHEQNHHTTSASSKKPADEESSEEEEDDNDSEDSNDSDSSNSDSSDDDASTAGRKSRKRGLLGLLGNK